VPERAAAADVSPHPPRRRTVGALLVGSGAAFATLLLCDLYGVLPPEVGAPFAALGPPARILVAIGVGAEGLVAAYLVATSSNPHEGPIVTHYGGRSVAGGGAAVALGIILYLLWATAGNFLPEPGTFLEVALAATLLGAAFLLSGLAVLASFLVAPWMRDTDA
jgi:hypothetical protein